MGNDATAIMCYGVLVDNKHQFPWYKEDSDFESYCENHDIDISNIVESWAGYGTEDYDNNRNIFAIKKTFKAIDASDEPIELTRVVIDGDDTFDFMMFCKDVLKIKDPKPIWFLACYYG